MALMALSFDMAPLRVTICFLRTIDAIKEAFEEGFIVFGRKILSVGTQISIKAPVCGGDFPIQVIGRSILTTSER